MDWFDSDCGNDKVEVKEINGGVKHNESSNLPSHNKFIFDYIRHCSY